jgi:hypothetical protein
VNLSWELTPRCPQPSERLAKRGNRSATITMPKKMSPQSWQMLIDTLELWKKQAGAGDVF